MNYTYFSPTGNGWRNLAADEYFLNTLGPDDFMLYFYINSNAVIIGQNQNAWRECNTQAMDRDGVQLVRRISGGGAVYHDEGNLNFSFIAGKARYDVHRQAEMILSAVRSFGIPCELSGRNDLTAAGRKFSGNAFCQRGGNMQHHGTLLVSADLSVMKNYLNVSADKLKSKGVKSVASRVCNLTEFCPELTVEKMAAAVTEACARTMGPMTPYVFTPEAEAEVDALYAKHSSWDWRMGRSPEFDFSVEGRFNWGGIQLGLSVTRGTVADVALYTDALDTALPAKAAAVLKGARFDPARIAQLLRLSGDSCLADIAGLVED